jgi:hypothetical protein
VICHVALEVRESDGDANVAFWALFGYSEVDVPETLAGATRWCAREGSQIHLLFTDTPVVPPQGHVALVARDYDAQLMSLERAGFPPEPRKEHWGSARCFVTAPSGHRVEIMRFPPRD